MKYVCFMLASFLAGAVFSAIPSSASEWYTPSDGFSRKARSGMVITVDDQGFEHVDWVSIGEDGKITSSEESNSKWYEVVSSAAIQAAQALIYAEHNKERIETIGKNLDSVFNVDGIEMVMEKQGPGGSTQNVTYKLKINPGSGNGGATIDATDPIPYGMVVDGKSIDWTQQNASGQISIYGVGAAYSGQIAYANGAGGIVWGYPQAGVQFDDVTITTNRPDGKAHLVGWGGGHECSTTISAILTEESGVNRSTHSVLTRYGTGDSATFHYVPMGDRLDFGGVEFDDVSVTSNDTGQAHLVGIENADENQIAYSDGDGGIFWDDSPPDVIYDPDSGVLGILPVGGSVLDDTYVYLPMINIVDGDDGWSFTWRDLGIDFTDTITIPHPSFVEFDNKTVTTNETGQAHLVGIENATEGQIAYADGNNGIQWKDAPSGTAFDDKTVTTNETGKAHLVGIGNTTQGQVAYADGNGGIIWGDLPPGVQFDDKTVTTNETGKAHLVGIGNAENGQVAYADGNAGITWGDLPPGVQFDDKTVTTNETGKAHLVGWGGGHECSTTISSILTEDSEDNRSTHSVLTRYGTGDSAVFHYVPMGDKLDFGGVGFDDKTVTTNDTGLAHLVDVENADEHQIAFADGSGGIFWDDSPPDVTYNEDNGVIGIHPIGGDVFDDTYIWLPMISIADGEDGYTFTYRDLGSDYTDTVIIPHQSTVAFDDKTVTTNITGQAHLVGIENATEGQIAYADGNSGIEWRDAPSGTEFDNKTVTTNETGKAHLVGIGNAENGQVAYADGNAGITWGDLPPGVQFDDKTVTTNETGKAHLVGIGSAREGQVAYADGKDGITWDDLPPGVQFDDITVTTNGTGRAHLVGWGGGHECGTTISSILTEDSEDNRSTHYVLTRYGTGDNASFHYVSMGDKLVLGDKVYFDNKTVTTNVTGAAHIVGIENADEGQIAYANGSDGITWDNPPPTVSYDEMDGVITIDPDVQNDSAEQTITLAKIKIEEAQDGYKFTWRDLDGDDTHDLTIPYASGITVDGESITTNTAQGAAAQGTASLYGWANAAADDLPQKDENGTLKWTSPAAMVDRKSLEWITLDGGGKVFEVKGAHAYDGNHAKYYFGTSVDKSATLGWHELPNMSTNRVEGDGITIASEPNIPGQQADPEVKKLGLRGWNYSLSGEPRFVANNNGSIDYISLGSITNLAACACTNKWNALLGWIEDGELDENNGITFKSESLDYYMWHDLGYIYSTTPDDNMYFNNENIDGSIIAGFPAPKNWADDVSIEEADGKYRLKNFENGGGCVANLNDMLTNTVQNCADKGKHQILCRYKNGANDPVVHWLPFPDDALVAGGGSKWTGSFSYFDGMIHSGCVTVGRTPILVSGMSATSGDYRIRVTLGANPTAVLESGSGFAAPSGNVSYIPVYTLSNGEVTADYRGSFVVPAYE